MSFLLKCPHCGERSVYEYRFGGEVKERPAPDADDAAWVNYTYMKVNQAGVQREWWFHQAGCRQWLQATRNTLTNEVLETTFPEGNA
jgi:heterotetrameric sarcosine oxidase delta subunit